MKTLFEQQQQQQSYFCAIYTSHSCQFDVSWLDSAVQNKVVGLLRFHMKTNPWNQSSLPFITSAQRSRKQIKTLQQLILQQMSEDCCEPFHPIRNMSSFPLLKHLESVQLFAVCNTCATCKLHSSIFFPSAWHGFTLLYFYTVYTGLDFTTKNVMMIRQPFTALKKHCRMTNVTPSFNVKRADLRAL